MKKLLAVFLLILLPIVVHGSATTLPLSHHFDTLAPFSAVLGNATVITDTTTPDQTNAARITYPAGFASGNTPEYMSVSFTGESELYFQYYFKLSSNWEWNPSGIDKQLYVWDTGGSENWVLALRWQKLNMAVQGSGAYYYQNQGNDFTASKGVWYKVVVHAKVNTAGNSDGVFEMWVDDVLRTRRTDVKYTDSGLPWRLFSFTPVWGGAAGYNTSQTMYIYFDYVKIQTTNFGAESDQTPPYVDTFSPGDGATGVAQGTTSASFRFGDTGDGADITTLDVDGKGCASCGSCDAGLTCSGTSAAYTITRTPLSLSYEEAWSEVITGSDLNGNAMTPRTFNFTVEPDPGPPTLEVTTTTLSDGAVGTSTPQTLASTGGVTPHTWSVVAGSLPSGRYLSSSGELTGEYTTSGTVEFTAQVADSDTPPNTDNQVLTQYVAPAASTGQTNATITAIEDTFINSGSTDNNASSNTYVEVYQWPFGTVANRTLDNVSFTPPDNVSVASAWLYMYMSGHEGSGGTDPMRVYAYRVGPQDISTVTWATFDNTLQPYESVTEVSLVPGWVSWDIKSMASWACANASPLYIAFDGGQDGAADTNRIFASMDGAEEFRPYIVVTYKKITNYLTPATPGNLGIIPGGAGTNYIQ
jgi:hypothetical protein